MSSTEKITFSLILLSYVFITSQKIRSKSKEKFEEKHCQIWHTRKDLPGMCVARDQIIYYWANDTSQCKEGYFQGCGRTVNNFRTLKDCEKTANPICSSATTETTTTELETTTTTKLPTTTTEEPTATTELQTTTTTEVPTTTTEETTTTTKTTTTTEPPTTATTEEITTTTKTTTTTELPTTTTTEETTTTTTELPTTTTTTEAPVPPTSIKPAEDDDDEYDFPPVPINKITAEFTHMVTRTKGRRRRRSMNQDGNKGCDGFICPENKQCIDEKFQCDTVNDCRDGSDENTCPCVGLTCDNGKECIERGYICDGEADCQDQSDEKYCLCRGFSCNSNLCLNETQLCDSRKDCADGSDEQDCDEHRKRQKFYDVEYNTKENIFAIYEHCDPVIQKKLIQNPRVSKSCIKLGFPKLLEDMNREAKKSNVLLNFYGINYAIWDI